MNRTSWIIAAPVALGLIAFGPAAVAHHSFAMFDQSQTTTFRGSIKDFQWSNPHVIVWVVSEAKSDPTPDVWTIELTSPGNLLRMGWTRHALKAGDKVDVEISPLRDGRHGGSLRKITLLDTGQVLTSSLISPAKPAN